MDRRRWYSVILPIVAILYAASLFLIDWDNWAVIGAFIIAIVAIAGRLFPASQTP